MRNYNNLKAEKPKSISNLYDIVKTGAAAYKDKDVYRYKENKEIKSITYSEYFDKVNQLGTAFSAIGIAGKHIAIIGDTHPMWTASFYAVTCGGSVAVPLDKELTDDQILNFLNISESTAVIYTDKFNGFFTSNADKLETVKFFIPIHDGEDIGHEGVLPIDSLFSIGKDELERGNTSFTEHKIEMDKMCSILFTSGTTGTSKGVMLSNRNFTTSAIAAQESITIDHRATIVSVLPVHHTYELTCTHLTALNLGVTIFINDNLKYATKNFKEQKPNTLILVPIFLETVYKKVWQEIRKKGMEQKVRAAMKVSDALLKLNIDLRPKLFADITAAFGGNLRNIIVGGAPIDPQIVRDFFSFGITTQQGYGITECSPLIAVNKAGHIRFDSVGWVVPGCEVKIDKMPDEEYGEVLARGGNVMLGYYKNEAATKEVFTDDGWFKTGDIGYLDRENYLVLTGRKKNIIILSNGKNIFPEELEEYIGKVQFVKESVVLGRKNQNGDLVVAAIVVPDMEVVGEIPHDEIKLKIEDSIKEINDKLPTFKHINLVEIRYEEFEKNPSKKIIRYKIK